jgi:hypothetical protein
VRPSVTLFRPVGQAELDRIRESGWHAFPPRLPAQPIFYPVLSEQYASHIAREWNTKDEFSGRVGYVTRFEVGARYLARFDVHKVGKDAEEYWIPAEQLAEFNANILSLIEVIAEYRGER